MSSQLREGFCSRNLLAARQKAFQNKSLSSTPVKTRRAEIKRAFGDRQYDKKSQIYHDKYYYVGFC